jgi:large subunit ribosomal protein L24
MAINVKKNDTVKIISGGNKGKQGQVVKVLRAKGKVLVDGVNLAKRHEKPNQTNQTGGIVDKEMPIDISNVMVIDPKSGKPSRINRLREAGKPSKRISVRDKNVID